MFWNLVDTTTLLLRLVFSVLSKCINEGFQHISPNNITFDAFVIKATLISSRFNTNHYIEEKSKERSYLQAELWQNL